MDNLLGILTPIALIDSTSMLPIGVVALAVLFAGKNPLLGATAFIGGMFATYLLCGILVTFGLGALFAKLNVILIDKWKNPDTLDLCLQIVIGGLLLTVGYRMAATRRAKEKTEKLERVTPARAFVAAGGLIIVGMPGAVPYLGAIDQILRADLPALNSVAALVFYDVIFVSPFIVLVAIRQLFPKLADRLFGVIGRIADSWGKRVIMVLLIILGLAMIVDGIGWFLGHPLIPV
ncbi:MAG: GAP family protein [Candidatus Latescibacterota bacterium]|nr:MAG: GAP family protein [Candidatus Latescibacterota bacterium]